MKMLMMARGGGRNVLLCVGLVLLLSAVHVDSNGSEAEHQEVVISREARQVRRASSLNGLYDFLLHLGLTEFCKYLRLSKVDELLLSHPTVTIFAPNDQAFAEIPSSILRDIRKNPQQLRDFILYHVVADDLPKEAIEDEDFVETLQGSYVRLNVYDEGRIVSVSGSVILDGDQSYSNALIHTVDRVLYPIPTRDLGQLVQKSNPRFYELLRITGISNLLIPNAGDTYTVLLPANDALQSLPEEVSRVLYSNDTLLKQILSDHILPGSIFSVGLKDGTQLDTISSEVLYVTSQRNKILIEGIPIVQEDRVAANGVVHVISRLIIKEAILQDCGCIPTRHASAIPSTTLGLDDQQPQSTPFSQLVRQQVTTPTLPTPSPVRITRPSTQYPGEVRFEVPVRPIPEVRRPPPAYTPVRSSVTPAQPVFVHPSPPSSPSGVSVQSERNPDIVIVHRQSTPADILRIQTAGVPNVSYEPSPETVYTRPPPPPPRSQLRPPSRKPSPPTRPPVIETSNRFTPEYPTQSDINNESPPPSSSSGTSQPQPFRPTRPPSSYVNVKELPAVRPIPAHEPPPSTYLSVHRQPGYQIHSVPRPPTLENVPPSRFHISTPARQPSYGTFQRVPPGNVISVYQPSQTHVQIPSSPRQPPSYDVTYGQHPGYTVYNTVSQVQHVRPSPPPSRPQAVDHVPPSQGISPELPQEEVLYTQPPQPKPYYPLREQYPGILGSRPRPPQIPTSVTEKPAVTTRTKAPTPPRFRIYTPSPYSRIPVSPYTTPSTIPTSSISHQEQPVRPQRLPPNYVPSRHIPPPRRPLPAYTPPRPISEQVPTNVTPVPVFGARISPSSQPPQSQSPTFSTRPPQIPVHSVYPRPPSREPPSTSIISVPPTRPTRPPPVERVPPTRLTRPPVLPSQRIPPTRRPPAYTPPSTIPEYPPTSTPRPPTQRVSTTRTPVSRFQDVPTRRLPPPPPREIPVRQPPQDYYGRGPSSRPHVVEQTEYRPPVFGERIRKITQSPSVSRTETARPVTKRPDFRPTRPSYEQSSRRPGVQRRPTQRPTQRPTKRPTNFSPGLIDLSELARGLKAKTFISWLQTTGVIDSINDGRPYTIFAPTDEAINRLSDNVQEKLVSDEDLLKQLLRYHITPIDVASVRVDNELIAPSLESGKELRFNFYGNGQISTVSGAILQSDRRHGNLYFVSVDRVLYIPQGDVYKTISKSPIMTKLTEAIKYARLDQYLSSAGPFTLFAPSDTAFDSLFEGETILQSREKLRELLLRHIVRGTLFSAGVSEGLTVKSESGDDIKLSIMPECIVANGVKVMYSDVTAFNGVVHVVDHFL